jgi:hypothetical protein
MKVIVQSAIFAAFVCPSMFAQPQCPGFPSCLYRQAQEYEFTKARQNITYTDVTGRSRTIEVTIRVPMNRPGTLPVIIWAHGGADGRNGVGASDGALSYWSTFSAAFGYLTVSPAFHARNEADQAALCSYLGADDRECEYTNAPSWDRPYDMKAILDFLRDQNQSGPFQGRIDMNRIAIGGHSAGSSGALSVAGASRQIHGQRYGATYFADPRPKAFIALSPSGPGFSYMFERGFKDNETSWDGVSRPVLMLSGSGDGHEQSPRARRIPFGHLPSGDKYRLFVNDVAFGHGAFGDDLSDCGGGIAEPRCAAFQSVLHSAVRAFLDAYVDQRPQALNYLRTGYVAEVGEEILEWLVK